MAIWDLQASAGAPGQSILWRGTWSSALSYNPYDGVIAANGNSYISKTNNANKEPSANAADWDLMVQGVQTPASSVNGEVVSYSGTTGKVFTTSSGKLTADLVTGPAIATANNVPLFNDTTGKNIKNPTAAELQAALNPSIWNVRLRNYNVINNPNFSIAQKHGSYYGSGWGPQTGGGHTIYVSDRWYMQFGGGTSQEARFSVGQQSASRPSTGGNPDILYGPFFWRYELGTQQTTLLTTTYYGIAQSIEGSQAFYLINGPSSLSFCVRSSVANLKFSVCIESHQDGSWANDYFWVQLCTLGAANTWTTFSFPNIPTIPPPYTTAIGMAAYTVQILVAAGTDILTSTLGAWHLPGSGLWKPGATGMDNFCSKPVGSTFDIAFVQHEPGTECTPFVPPPFAENLHMCQRFYQKSYNYDVAVGAATDTGQTAMCALAVQSPIGEFSFPVTMCKTPTIYSWSPVTGVGNAVRDVYASVDRGISLWVGVGTRTTGYPNLVTTNAGVTIYFWQWEADANI